MPEEGEVDVLVEQRAQREATIRIIENIVGDEKANMAGIKSKGVTVKGAPHFVFTHNPKFGDRPERAELRIIGASSSDSVEFNIDLDDAKKIEYAHNPPPSDLTYEERWNFGEPIDPDEWTSLISFIETPLVNTNAILTKFLAYPNPEER